MRFKLLSIKFSVAPPSFRSDYCRTRGYQIVERSADNEAVLGSSRKLGGATEHLNDGNKNTQMSVDL